MLFYSASVCSVCWVLCCEFYFETGHETTLLLFPDSIFFHTEMETYNCESCSRSDLPWTSATGNMMETLVGHFPNSILRFRPIIWTIQLSWIALKSLESVLEVIMLVIGTFAYHICWAVKRSWIMKWEMNQYFEYLNLDWSKCLDLV